MAVRGRSLESYTFLAECMRPEEKWNLQVYIYIYIYALLFFIVAGCCENQEQQVAPNSRCELHGDRHQAGPETIKPEAFIRVYGLELGGSRV